MKISLLKHLFYRKQKQPKIYNSYNEALRDIKNHEGYEDKELCKIVAEKTLRYKSILKKRPYEINANQGYLVMMLQHILLATNQRVITVMDFGGACGAHYFETRRLIPAEIKLHWNVVETDEMVKQAEMQQLHNDELHFYNNFETLDADVAYLSSSIQYVPEPYEVIKKLVDRKYAYILFNRMMLNSQSDDDTVIVQQSMLSDNGPGAMPEEYKDRKIFYPHTTLSERRFLKQFEDEYKLIFRFDESSGKINHDKSITGGGYLFQLKNI